VADQSLAGLIAGFDMAWSESSYAGIFIGAAKADLAVDDEAQDITTDNFWGGAYLSRYSGRYRFDFAALAGWQSNESTRRMVDNTVLGGVDYAVASYDGFFVSPEASMSRDWNFAGQPVNSAFTLRYAGLFLDAYEEDGSNADLTVEGRDVHSLTAKGELIRPFEIQFADSSLLLEGLAGAEGRYTFGDEVAATLLTENISFDPDNESFTMAGFAGAQATYTALSGAAAMSFGGKASASTDSALTLAARLTAELHF
jgi:autotransporter-like protein